MFGVGFKPNIKREELRTVLERCILNPDKAWIPISPAPRVASSVADIPRWNRGFPRVSDDTKLPARHEVEELCDAYFRMGFWDFAFVIVTYAYTGEMRMRELDRLIWEGLPGVSRLWIVREDMAIPLPKTGPIRRAAETWWALSGGYSNHLRKCMPIYESEFLEHFRSLNSPILLSLPFESDDPDYVLSRLCKAIGNELAYPLKPSLSLSSGVDFSETQIKGPIRFYKDIPIDWSPFDNEVESIKKTPWGLKWLEAAKDTIPARIYRRAHNFRLHRFEKL